MTRTTKKKKIPLRKEVKPKMAKKRFQMTMTVDVPLADTEEVGLLGERMRRAAVTLITEALNCFEIDARDIRLDGPLPTIQVGTEVAEGLKERAQGKKITP